jgi:hypothetical protein
MCTTTDELAPSTVAASAAAKRPQLEVVMATLRASPYPPLRSVTCSERGDVLKLQGCVPSYYLKQLAQSLVLHLDTSYLIENEIEVVSPGAGFSLRGACYGSKLS